MKVSRSGFAVTLATLAFIVVSPAAREGRRAQSPPGPYVVTDLGTFGSVQSAHANDINEAGHVVGSAASHPFLWRDGVMTDLTVVAGATGGAADINNVGQIAGSSGITPNTPAHPVLWENGAMTDLAPDLAANEGGGAIALNDLGEVVGNISYSAPFRWKNGVRTTLGHLGGGGGRASDINEAGQIVGASYTTETSELLGLIANAVLWENGEPIDLGRFPGDDDASAAAINNLGQIVGTSGRTDIETYESTYRSFIYENGQMTALPVPSSESYASDINDSGVVVGAMRAPGGMSNYHAYIYADGVVTNLNNLLPSGSGLHLLYALSINNDGQIVGVAYDSRASYHAYLLTPAAPGTPVFSIGDTSVTEGHSGTRSANFTVTLAPASSQAVTVSFSTANGSAAGGDYQSASGTVTFAAGQTSKTISVLVNGDRAGETDETFVVNLSQATGGPVIGDAQGIGTIVDDEPRVNINSVTKNEGNSGSTQFVFTVSLSSASSAAVSLNFATANGSAKSGEDYDAISGSLSFAAGQTSRTITVVVKGDRKKEWQEVFYVNLSGANGAYIPQSWGVNIQGTGVIKNDD